MYGTRPARRSLVGSEMATTSRVCLKMCDIIVVFVFCWAFNWPSGSIFVADSGCRLWPVLSLTFSVFALVQSIHSLATLSQFSQLLAHAKLVGVERFTGASVYRDFSVHGTIRDSQCPYRGTP